LCYMKNINYEYIRLFEFIYHLVSPVYKFCADHSILGFKFFKNWCCSWKASYFFNCLFNRGKNFVSSPFAMIQNVPKVNFSQTF